MPLAAEGLVSSHALPGLLVKKLNVDFTRWRREDAGLQLQATRVAGRLKVKQRLYMKGKDLMG